MTVYKYQLSAKVETRVELPKGAQVLKIDIQGNAVCLWAMVDPDAEKEARTFEVFGTWHSMPVANRLFINTFFAQSGTFVFHAFERI